MRSEGLPCSGGDALPRCVWPDASPLTRRSASSACRHSGCRFRLVSAHVVQSCALSGTTSSVSEL
jgi:hypothetical protein